MGAIITLTTDFGDTEAYVAAMKGVILGINPDATLVDICHTVRPQDVRQAAFILSTAHSFFPAGTVHLVVVDPGVGTNRRAIILSTPSAKYVAPDNGVLSYVMAGFRDRTDKAPSEQLQALSPGLEAVAITDASFWRSLVSPTFHGRDIFSPVAARLSLGVPAGDFGEAIDTVTMLPLSHPETAADGALVGHIRHIDHFGSLITDITGDDLPQETAAVTIAAGGQLIPGLSRTYADREGLSALTGSSGYLEIALKNGSAASFLGAKIGDKVRVTTR